MYDYTELVLATEDLRSNIPYIRRSLTALQTYGPEVTEPVRRAISTLCSTVALLDEMDRKVENCPACNGGAYDNQVYLDVYEPCPVCIAIDNLKTETGEQGPPKWATECIPLEVYECNY